MLSAARWRENYGGRIEGPRRTDDRGRFGRGRGGARGERLPGFLGHFGGGGDGLELLLNFFDHGLYLLKRGAGLRQGSPALCHQIGQFLQ